MPSPTPADRDRVITYITRELMEFFQSSTAEFIYMREQIESSAVDQSIIGFHLIFSLSHPFLASVSARPLCDQRPSNQRPMDAALSAFSSSSLILAVLPSCNAEFLVGPCSADERGQCARNSRPRDGHAISDMYRDLRLPKVACPAIFSVKRLRCQSVCPLLGSTETGIEQKPRRFIGFDAALSTRAPRPLALQWNEAEVVSTTEQASGPMIAPAKRLTEQPSTVPLRSSSSSSPTTRRLEGF